MRALSKSLANDGHGWFADVYSDDDGASGYGDNPMAGRWYGSRAECEALDPRAVELRPFRPNTAADPFDVACEQRHD